MILAYYPTKPVSSMLKVQVVLPQVALASMNSTFLLAFKLVEMAYLSLSP